MKKIIAFILAAFMCISLLTACGEGNNNNGNNANANQETNADNNGADVTGETFDAGDVSCVVPSGWKAFPSKDMFAKDDSNDPGIINVCKGAETETDMLTKPYIRINYYGPSTIMMEPSKDYYDNAADLDDMTIGDYTWHAFSCDSMGYKYYMLWTGADDGDQFSVSVLYESTGGSIKLEDADVQAIIASIKPSKQAE